MTSAALAQAPVAAAPLAEGWLVDRELIDPAYAQTIAGGPLQTSIPPQPPPPHTPEWLKALMGAIGDFLQWAAPAFTPLIWLLAALLLLLLLYRFVPSFARWVDRLSFRKAERPADEDDGEAKVEAGAARALLAEADALAAAGRFADALHLLLYRSIQEISVRRPGLVQPAMTSRALADAQALPSAARDAFSRIAGAVEISLFGGRAIDETAWKPCRAAYAELTIARNWARA